MPSYKMQMCLISCSKEIIKLQKGTKQAEFLKNCSQINTICIQMDVDVTENSCDYEMD